MKDPALIVLLSLFVSLSGCGNGKSEATNTKSANLAQKEAGRHEGDHPENADDHARHASGIHKEGKVVLTPAQIKTAGIELTTVGPAPIRETLPLYGAVAPNAERVRDVAARYAGTIRRVDKKIGDQVRQGETLATVESNESLQTYAIVTPLAGVVTARNANPGEQTSDKSLFTVADLSTVWIELSLFPRDVAKVRVGQSVRVKNTDAGLSADGTMAYVAPFGSSANQTLTARVILNNAEHRWAPGLYVNADVTLSEQTVALAIRNDAVQIIEGKSVVFVQRDGGFEPHPVRLGRSDGEFSELLAGPEVGETYVTTNSFVLKAELIKGQASHEH